MFVGIYEVVRSGKGEGVGRIVVASLIKAKDQQSEQEEICEVDNVRKSGNESLVSSVSVTLYNWYPLDFIKLGSRNPAPLFPQSDFGISLLLLFAQVSHLENWEMWGWLLLPLLFKNNCSRSYVGWKQLLLQSTKISRLCFYHCGVEKHTTGRPRKNMEYRPWDFPSYVSTVSRKCHTYVCCNRIS